MNSAETSVNVNMSENASSNSCLRPPLASFRTQNCFLFFSTFSITNDLGLLLLFVLVLLLDCHQRRTQRCVSAVRDVVVVYNSMAMQLEELSGVAFFFFASYTKQPHLIWPASTIIGSGSHGQLLLHLLTCVECYVAVVHPVFFMGLRKKGVVKLRNMCLCCVWLLCGVGIIALHFAHSLKFMLFYISFTAFLLLAVALCSITVLRALRRPRPGEEVDGRTRRVDQSKQRAFRTIMTILTALLFKLVGTVSCAVLVSEGDKNIISCTPVMVIACFDVPGNMVLPVLYLHHTRKRQQQPRN
ncbi:hypothetical protein JOB18_041526 [Solea senegalensis]|uniref:G-protein coupled receptors family 1 profile domain-containing protein n=1 Tax=Solea senegalensis TaxID=28829 RepID=A0AAV6QX05_SOLSE|nr:hypothetical protein JOB18_041526 [Solea senegalensis]